MSRALSALRPVLDTTEVENIIDIGLNPGHDINLTALKDLHRKKQYKLSKVLKDLTRNRNFGINVAKNLFPSNKVKRNKRSGKDEQNKIRATIEKKPSLLEPIPNLAWIN